MQRRIKRNQRNVRTAAEKRQRRMAVMALGGLLALSPNLFLPPQIMALTVNSESELRSALSGSPVAIDFGSNISLTSSLSANNTASSVTINGVGHTLNGNGYGLLQFGNTGGISLNLNGLNVTGGLSTAFSSGGAGAFIYNMAGGNLAGNSFYANSANYAGGGMYIKNLAGGGITGNSFNANYAGSSGGGGLYISAMSGGSVTNNNFNANSTLNNGGGGMHVSSMNGGLVAYNTFTNNATSSAAIYQTNNSGGGMYVRTMASGSITSNSFNANSAYYGGGMYVSSLDNGNINSNTFTNNAASSGGGMYVSSMADGNVIGNTFTTNSATNYGGGMFVSAMAGGSVNGNFFYANSATSGGGMFASAMNGGSIAGNLASGNLAGGGGGMTVWNINNGSVSANSLLGNYATNYGGGLYVYTMNGGSITGNVVSANSANSGGGMFINSMNGGSVTNNIINANTAPTWGGGMWVGTMTNGATVTSNSLTGNSTNSQGGGMWVSRLVNGGVNYNTASANQAAYGGGMNINAISGGTVTGNSITGNTATTYGGGMYVYSMLGGAMTGNLFQGNVANSGGGMFVSAVGGGNIYGNTINENLANLHGGGMYVYYALGGTITGNNFNCNSAVGNGGGMYILYATNADLTDNNFRSNRAHGYGGAIYYRTSAASGAFSLNATSGQKVQFIGNRHQAGTSAFTPNSIYFGIENDANNLVNLAIQVENGGQLIMQDPVMSQASTARRSVTVNLEKTGNGLWQLAGHNQMRGPSTWKVSQGTLQLINDTDGDPAHIDLSDTTTSQFNLEANAIVCVDAPGHNSHRISAQNVTLANGSIVKVNTMGLITGTPALQINSPGLTLPGTFIVDALNAGALNGTYTLLSDATGATSFAGKALGLFDGHSTYIPLNRRYGTSASYDFSQPGQIIIQIIGADMARQATWDNDSGDHLWNLTSENWLLDGSIYKFFKAGDSPIFSGSPDGLVKVDGAMHTSHMQVQDGSYTFSPNNTNNDSISGQRLDINGGQAAFDVPLIFIGDGGGEINIANNAAMLLAPETFVVTHTFNASGALNVVPTTNGLVVDASIINFNPGSRVGVSGFNYGPQLSNGIHTVLSLVAPDITNNSTIPVTGGVIQVGAFDYEYHDLYWDGDRLVMRIDQPQPSPNPERMAASATTGPLAMAAQMTPGTWLMPRFRHSFSQDKNLGKNLAASMLNPGFKGGMALDGEPDLLAGGGYLLNQGAHAESGYNYDEPHMLPAYGTGGKAQARLAGWKANASGGGEMLLNGSSLWFTPTYSYTDQNGRSGYNIKTPTWAAGYEQWFNNDWFLGLAVAGSLPEYESACADIDGKNISVALYGGTVLPGDIDLGAFVSYGHSNYDQTRRVQGRTYNSDYDSINLGFGLNIARGFTLDDSGLYVLRPFASYEYLRLDVDGYDEGPGTYALVVDEHKENLHLVRTGLDATLTSPDNGAYVGGRIYYAGLYGDRQAEASAFFIADPANPFTSVGDALDQHSLGLGLNAGIALNEDLELQAGYNFLVGEDSKTHQGSISFMLKF